MRNNFQESIFLLSLLLLYSIMPASPTGRASGSILALGCQTLCKGNSASLDGNLSANLYSFSAIAYFYIDSKGRRFLLMTSLAAMVPLLLASGFSFLSNDNNVKVGLVSTFLILYTLAYSPGAGVVPFLYTSEIFPQVLRGKQCLPLSEQYCSRPTQPILMPCVEVGMAWGSAVTFFGAGLLALTVPQLINSIGQTALLGLFA